MKNFQRQCKIWHSSNCSLMHLKKFFSDLSFLVLNEITHVIPWVRVKSWGCLLLWACDTYINQHTDIIWYVSIIKASETTISPSIYISKYISKKHKCCLVLLSYACILCMNTCAYIHCRRCDFLKPELLWFKKKTPIPL